MAMVIPAPAKFDNSTGQMLFSMIMQQQQQKTNQAFQQQMLDKQFQNQLALVEKEQQFRKEWLPADMIAAFSAQTGRMGTISNIGVNDAQIPLIQAQTEQVKNDFARKMWMAALQQGFEKEMLDKKFSNDKQLKLTMSEEDLAQIKYMQDMTKVQQMSAEADMMKAKAASSPQVLLGQQGLKMLDVYKDQAGLFKQVADDPTQHPSIRDQARASYLTSVANFDNLSKATSGNLFGGQFEMPEPIKSVVTDPIYTKAFNQKTQLEEIADKFLSMSTKGNNYGENQTQASDTGFALKQLASSIDTTTGKYLPDEQVAIADLVKRYGVTPYDSITVEDGGFWGGSTSLKSLINQGRLGELFSNPDMKKSVIEQTKGAKNSALTSLRDLLLSNHAATSQPSLTPDAVLKEVGSFIDADWQNYIKSLKDPIELQKELDDVRSKLKARQQAGK